MLTRMLAMLTMSPMLTRTMAGGRRSRWSPAWSLVDGRLCQVGPSRGQIGLSRGQILARDQILSNSQILPRGQSLSGGQILSNSQILAT